MAFMSAVAGVGTQQSGSARNSPAAQMLASKGQDKKQEGKVAGRSATPISQDKAGSGEVSRPSSPVSLEKGGCVNGRNVALAIMVVALATLAAVAFYFVATQGTSVDPSVWKIVAGVSTGGLVTLLGYLISKCCCSDSKNEKIA
ncbi:MAG: hypothetical protein S4CHLAM45_02800 [Chlamydiales bacterium]|nr:hypothetical protein [Chlamydiales bacterium]MCH9619138.1 hypothetical protein [Chlamydiales bacterium]MCH9622400.1 hypothetical protein [Chlamydiales bacterium]